jgi:uncharacterized protein YuzE
MHNLQEKQFLDVLPEFGNVLIEALRAASRPEIADQFATICLRRVTYDQSVDAGYLYVTESRALNVVEQNIIGVKHGECIGLEGLPGIVVIDVDNFGRIMRIELIGYEEVFRQFADYT